jgi:HEAT repeat protein
MKQEKVIVSSREQIIPLCIELLMERLHSENGAERQRAREALVRIGKSATTFVLPSLSHPDRHVRWEACKTLERIRDPQTARTLTMMLMDDDMAVRWVAAAALIELEQYAVEPLLEMIEEHFDSSVFRESAHHVLHSLKEIHLLDEKTAEVLNALKVNELPSKAAFAAIQALDHLRSHSFA